jgi:hypothetical protein
VVKALLVLVLVHGVAAAEVGVTDDPDLDAGLANKLGFHMGGGSLPLGTPFESKVIGVELEHPLIGHLRGFADYSYVSVLEDVEPARVSPVVGDGDRLSIGVRHEIIGKTWEHLFRLALDAELGGGVQWTNDGATHDATLPLGLAGIHACWAILAFETSSETLILEPYLDVRAIVIDRGAGLEISLGWAFGN